MHEASIAQAILSKGIALVGDNGSGIALPERCVCQKSTESNRETASLTCSGVRIARIAVRIGQFRNVDPESLQFVFDTLRKDFEMTEQSVLDIELVSTEAVCRGARHHFHPSMDNFYSCTICQSGIDEIVAGNELDIVSIDVENRGCAPVDQ
ncbi:MAG: hydrogenase maturation nickel metallochaperone HypA [Cyanobacteria bacterium]|nr:hydrogenase maturation nickel metallochaperone HypA [Cyanobacteriota bacterium]